MYTLSMNGFTKTIAWGLSAFHVVVFAILAMYIYKLSIIPEARIFFAAIVGVGMFLLPVKDSNHIIGTALVRRPVLMTLSFILYELAACYVVVAEVYEERTFFWWIGTWLFFDWVWTRLGE